MAMRAHPAVYSVQEAACGAVKSLAANADVRGKTTAMRAIEAVVEALKAHGAHAGLVEEACGALCNLAVSSPPNKERVAAVGGMMAVVTSARLHKAKAGVQEAACAALWSLAADSPENQARGPSCLPRPFCLLPPALAPASSLRSLLPPSCEAHGSCLGHSSKCTLALAHFAHPLAAPQQLHAPAAWISRRASFAPRACERRCIAVNLRQALLAEADGIAVVVDGMNAHLQNVEVQARRRQFFTASRILSPGQCPSSFVAGEICCPPAASPLHLPPAAGWLSAALAGWQRLWLAVSCIGCAFDSLQRHLYRPDWIPLLDCAALCVSIQWRCGCTAELSRWR